MIKVSESAYRQILLSMEKGNAQGLGLRVAAKREKDGSFKYAMGFDEVKDDDVVTEEREIKIVYGQNMAPLVQGMTIEFDVVDDGEEPQFIFLNPNDPAFVPPSE
jgi:iron-sulfur cluster assembly protein